MGEALITRRGGGGSGIEAYILSNTGVTSVEINLTKKYTVMCCANSGSGANSSSYGGFSYYTINKGVVSKEVDLSTGSYGMYAPIPVLNGNVLSVNANGGKFYHCTVVEVK